MYDPARKEQCFIVLSRKISDPPRIAQSPDEIHTLHRAFVQSLSDRKLLMSSGPAKDESGATHLGSIYILRVPSLADAERIVGQDPQILHGQRRPEIIPWLRMWFEDDPPAKKA